LAFFEAFSPVKRWVTTAQNAGFGTSGRANVRDGDFSLMCIVSGWPTTLAPGDKHLSHLRRRMTGGRGQPRVLPRLNGAQE
jgi:hypothetical protein